MVENVVGFYLGSANIYRKLFKYFQEVNIPFIHRWMDVSETRKYSAKLLYVGVLDVANDDKL